MYLSTTQVSSILKQKLLFRSEASLGEVGRAAVDSLTLKFYVIFLILCTTTGCVIISDAFLVRSSARTVIGSQTVDGCRRDPRQPSHMVGGE